MTANAGDERREHARLPTTGEAILRREGANKFRVRVFDFSQSGCMVEIIERPTVGEGVWIKFEGIEAVHATVSWVGATKAGLSFDRPIYAAVAEALLRKLN